jgi:hypothetical protein
VLRRQRGHCGGAPRRDASYDLLEDGKPDLTCRTTARGTEATVPTAHLLDRTVLVLARHRSG